MTVAFAAVVEYAERLGVVNANRLPGAWTQRVDDRWHIAFNAHDFPVEAKPEGCMECTIAPYTCAVWYNGWLTGMMTAFEGHIGFGTGATEEEFIAAIRLAYVDAARKAGEEPR